MQMMLQLQDRSIQRNYGSLKVLHVMKEASALLNENNVWHVSIYSHLQCSHKYYQFNINYQHDPDQTPVYITHMSHCGGMAEK